MHMPDNRDDPVWQQKINHLVCLICFEKDYGLSRTLDPLFDGMLSSFRLM